MAAPVTGQAKRFLNLPPALIFNKILALIRG